MELKPTKFDISKLNHPSNTPDRFGQTYKADDDASKWSDQSPQESRRAHTRSDVDLSNRSLHHTLGTNAGQASPGNHSHDGITARKIGPLEMDPVNLGKTRAQWTIPTSPTVADVVNLLAKFVEFRQV